MYNYYPFTGKFESIIAHNSPFATKNIVAWLELIKAVSDTPDFIA